MKQLRRSNTFALALLILGNIGLQSQSQEAANCYDANGQPTRCEPLEQSFSFGQIPRVNSTCGTPSHSFCFRTVSLGIISNNCTGVCDASDPNNAHPPNLMTDNNESWWQSENSLDPQTSVMIELSLGTTVEISFIALRFKSLKPSAFYIEKSTDAGANYQPFHYFSTSCNEQYMIEPDATLGFNNETAALCQPISIPPEPGRIRFVPTTRRPSANDSIPGFSENLYSFLTASDIRIILDEHFIIDNLEEDDPGYYYAIEDLNVVGSCQCNGHASTCAINPQTGQYQCACQHNTTGNFCEQCREFYYDVPWQRADGNESFECKSCNCNGHSTQCVFNASVYEETGRMSGGVCLNCTDNTAGRQCETCTEFFYPRDGFPQTDPNVCTACACDLRGVIDNGDCARTASNTSQPGDCNCKANVVGSACSECRQGYFNLSAANQDGCLACGCNITGSADSACNQLSGVCTCKPNIVGDKCDICRAGYYHVDPTSSTGCQPCNCNVGGALSNECDMFSGQCYCRAGVTGRTCSETTSGYFFPAIDSIRLEGENAGGIPSPNIRTSGENTLFTGTGYYRVIDRVSIINFGTVVPPVSGTYEVTFRYNLQGVIQWNTATLYVVVGSQDGTGPSDCGELPIGTSQILYGPWTMGAGLTISQSVCLRGGRSYTFILQDFNSGQTGGSATLDIDSLVVILTTSSSLQVFSDMTLAAQYSSCVDTYWRRLTTQSTADPSCEQVAFAVSTELYNGTLMCDCDSTGSVPTTTCQSFGGQCMCLPGVRGRQCDECSPGHYSFSATGCSECNCHVNGSTSDICQTVGGSCTCRSNVEGRDCSSCVTNYWGLNSEFGCVQCSCSDTGSESLQCDQSTGVCTCKVGVGGDSCNQCQDFHYGFSDSGCSACACSDAGATNENCDVLSGQCTCRTNTNGRDCSQCVGDTINLQDSNPDGCQPCFCSGQSNNCTSALGFASSSVVTQFNSSDLVPLQGWIVVSLGSPSDPNPETIVRTMPSNGGGITILANSSDAYLQAPIDYLGNKLSSYNQFLNIMLGPAIRGIQVQTVLQYDVILSSRDIQIGANFSGISGSGMQTVSVQLHESRGWRNIQTNQPPSAYELQLVLSSLDQLLITAGFSTDVIFYSISLDTTIPAIDGTIPWVEQCMCPTNYTGFSCEQCAPEYTRSPTGTCELCQCNGLSTTCDPETGDCTNCSGFANGSSCEQCISGSYGDPLQDIACQLCPCPFTSGLGRFADECVLLPAGVPMCIDCPRGHSGLQCEACAEGFFGDPLGTNGSPTMCSDCLCNGNINPSIPGSCDTTTGVCLMCLNNTTGNQCERCIDGFYGDAIVANNCTACECDRDGSNGTTCDQTTGQCQCLPSIVGLKCDQCAPDHYGHSSGSGCTPCDCHIGGAVSSQCDVASGQCTCKSGVTGRTCNECQIGFFGFSSSGCQECVCSPVNSVSNSCAADGECVCRLGATGVSCQQCVENYFQTLQGCAECPECYQELQASVNTTRSDLQTTDSRILAVIEMMTTFNPFNSRFSAQQQVIQNQERDIQALQQRHNMLVDQYEGNFSLISQAFPAQIFQINSSLEMLRELSTTIFALASTAEELMNRTTEELSTTIQILDDIMSEFLPLVQTSAGYIERNASAGNLTAINLVTNVALLTSQVENLMNLTSSITVLSSSALSDAQEMQTLHMDTIQIAAQLDQNLIVVEMVISALRPQLAHLSLNIAATGDRIRQEFDNLALVPAESQLNDLILNASISEGFARSVENETTTQQARLSELNGTLNVNRQELDSLQQQISTLTENTSNLARRSENAYNISIDTSTVTNNVVSEAENVLRNLQTFNNNSFEVAVSAMEALQNVRVINSSAAFALTTAMQIQDNVTLAGQDISSAKQLALQAENITQQAEQDTTEDTANLVSSVNASLNSTSDTLNDIISNSTIASDILLNLENQSVLINNTDQLVETGTAVANQSEGFRNRARSAVDTLQQDLLNIDGVDSAKLVSVQMFITTVEQEITMQNISTMFQILRDRLQEQQRTRQLLQAELSSLQGQIMRIRNINSALPQDCDSNL